jgi:GH24 family phage-related lysozyme (muramidase)
MDAKQKAIALALATGLAIPAEGIRQRFYYDPPGILTVCYGHTGADVDKAKTYTLAECKTLLTKDMLYAVDTVDKCQPGLPTNVLAAFADAVYNLGPTIACDTNRSTAARLLRGGDIAGACAQLPRWDKATLAGVAVSLPGLTARRIKERDLCLS